MEARFPAIYRALAAIPAPPLIRLLLPLDALRARLLRSFAPLARSLIVARERRVALAASLLLISAYISASTIPLWALALGPLLWGIPHVLSDIRYLIVRKGLHKRRIVLAVIAIGVISAALGAGVRGALAAAFVAALLGRGPRIRRVLAAFAILPLFAIALWAGWKADLAFAHLHNIVAFALWWAWRRRESKLHLLPLALFAFGSLLLLTGAAAPTLALTGGLASPWTGLSIRHLAWGLSPTMAEPWASRFIVLYAFAQSAHYVVWLRLIPEDDRRSHTPRSYTQSFRALGTDLGALVLWGALLSALALAVWAALLGFGNARDGYLKLAFFHGYLEIIVAGLLFVEGGLGASPKDPPLDPVLPG